MLVLSDKEYALFEKMLQTIIESDTTEVSNMLPSEWCELNVIMEEPFPGPYRYSLTPYWKEVIDCFAIDHPMLWIAIMKGAQIGFSAGVLIPVLLWSIVHDPCRIYYMVGSSELVEKATEKLDKGIKGAGIRHLIKDQTDRTRSLKSGDTNFKKTFPGGFIQIGNPNNHANLRDVSLRKGLFDDFEAMKRASKKSGSTRKMLDQRFAAYEGRHKICYGSTPELAEDSNIEEAYLLGDQREYLTPCPCCGEFIAWEWSITVGNITGGITWKDDPETGKVIPESVGYTCQLCGDFFDDKNKQELLNAGYWQPTAEPSKPGFFSYRISALYAPIGFFDWLHYIHDYKEANPDNQPRNEELWKTFVNVVLGKTYKPSAVKVDATAIMGNTPGYEIGVIPNQRSIDDGNGPIVLLTCGADCNGTTAGINSATVDDARLDYEIVAHAANGATYSILHGSIGTFVSREGQNKADRDRWTYAHNKPNSVWPVYNAVIRKAYPGDNGGFWMINRPSIDTGAYSEYVEAFIDWSIGKDPANPVMGVRGHKEDSYMRDKMNVALFQPGKARTDVYYLQVGLFKDMISNYMQLRWDKNDPSQPPNYMNFPMSGKYICPFKEAYYKKTGMPYDGDHLYQFDNYFSHFQSEHRTEVTLADGSKASRWVKIKTTNQNHQWDNRVYNLANKEIIVRKTMSSVSNEKEWSWTDYVNYVTG